MSVTVRDLLKLPSLQNARVVAGEQGLNQIVTSISVLEYAEPSVLQDELFRNNEFYGSEIVITGFINVKDDVQAQCATIRRLHEVGEVGLILYYVGIFLPHIDPQVMALADQLGFTLICMPEKRMDLRYSEAIYEVMEAILKDQMLDTYLVGEMLERISRLPERQRSMDTVLRMLRDRLTCSFFLLDSRLSVLNMAYWPSVGHISAAEILDFYQGNVNSIPREPEVVRVPREFCVCVGEIKNEEILPMYLLCAKENGVLTREIFRQAAEVVQLFVNIWSSTHAEVGTEELIKAILNDEPVKMRRLAEILHIDVASIHHMMLVLPRTDIQEKGALRDFNTRVSRKSRDFISSCYSNPMSGIYNDVFVIFTGEGKEAKPYSIIGEEFVRELESGDEQILLVNCLGLENTTDVREAYVKCMDCARYSRYVFPGKQAVTLQEIKFIGECREIVDRGEESIGRAMEVLKPVTAVEEEQRRELLTTLEVYFLDAEMSVLKTSQLLFLHKNTVKYRIGKLNDLFNYKINRMPESYELYRVMAIRRLLQKGD